MLPLAPVPEIAGGHVQEGSQGRKGGDGGLALASMSSALASASSFMSSKSGRSGSMRAPPREPAPAVTDTQDVGRALAAARSSMNGVSRQVSMSIENRGGGRWGGMAWVDDSVYSSLNHIKPAHMSSDRCKCKCVCIYAHTCERYTGENEIAQYIS